MNQKFEKALDSLQKISDESVKMELTYIMWIAKCHIMIGATDDAWKCLDTEDLTVTYELLQLIANDCYKKGGFQFIYSARAFRELYEIDKFPNYLNGIIGACVGYFQYYLAQIRASETVCEDTDILKEVIETLKACPSPKCRSVAETIQNWLA